MHYWTIYYPVYTRRIEVMAHACKGWMLHNPLTYEGQQ